MNADGILKNKEKSKFLVIRHLKDVSKSIYHSYEYHYSPMLNNRIVIAFLFLTNYTFCLNVRFLNMNENDVSAYQDIIYSYFMSLETSSMVKIENPVDGFRSPLAAKKADEDLMIVYPNDISISFEFLDELNSESSDEIMIYMTKDNLSKFTFFIKILQNNDNVISNISTQAFFETLKYLNILRVIRNKNYKIFIKSLVHYSFISSVDFVSRASDSFLNAEDYNNLQVRDVIKIFMRFYFMKNPYIYKMFHKNRLLRFSSTLHKHRKQESFKKITCMFFFQTCYLHKYLSKTKAINIWKILMNIFSVDKLCINLFPNNNVLDLDLMISLLPKKVIKFTVHIPKKLLPIFNKLYQIGFFDSVKNIEITYHDEYKSFLEILQYFKNLEKLTLELLWVNYEGLVDLMRFEGLESIKVMKILINKEIYFPRNITANSTLKTNANIIVDISDRLEISDIENGFKIFSSYRFHDFVCGIDLVLCKESYNSAYFFQIFNFELIKRLKVDLKNVRNNRLESYEFLESFKSLTKLYLKDIKLSHSLFKAILRSNRLLSIVYDDFKTTGYNEIDTEMGMYNESVIRMSFYSIQGDLNNNLFVFLSKFKALTHLFFDLHCLLYDYRFFDEYQDEVRDLDISLMGHWATYPKLKSLKYINKFGAKNITSYSVLRLFSYFFNLEDLLELYYNVSSLYELDILVFSKFKALKYLNLSIKETDKYFEILRQILNQNIKNTIFKLEILTGKYKYYEILLISKFKKLKILKIGFQQKDEIDIESLECLICLNLIEITIYVIRGTSNYYSGLYIDTIFTNI
ncbi:hypothetical protein LUQ84_003050 [Hamiltosporidium tvaerminnensis]|nr:hypothetical protein LUQ84_003050 [Hamiltosporidium tvaerminnensis]